jgi:DNA-3-methyladenine glycosylase I
MEIKSCTWPANHQLAILYHNEEWGVPVHDDLKHFEYLVLDAFQAGLSWNTILNKRENFRKAFDSFDFMKISKYDQSKVLTLLADSGIVRNKLKIEATISNAREFQKIIEEFGSFDVFIWQFTNGNPIVNKIINMKDIPSKTEISDKMSKELVLRGFKFVGSTICYAYMQAAGLVNDHLITCPRHAEIQKYYR